jgi:hypothetical protein
MRVIIAGGRDFDDYGKAHEALYRLFLAGRKPGVMPDLEIVGGGARGADELGKIFAEDWDFPYKEFCADWDKHGKSAGAIRNEQMAKYADMLVAFWDGESPGTKHMIQTALEYGLEVHVHRYELSDTGKVI